MQKEIAIIIPAYNAHETIGALLYSISAQTKADLCQTIIIDDCDSRSYDYLYELFPNLDLTILRMSKNSGPSLARNKGIAYAIKKNIPYIVFADADDQFFSVLSIELLYSQMEKQNADLVFGNFYEILDNQLFEHEDIDIWLFGKIYRTELIKNHNIIFPDSSINEDVCFNLHYWLVSNKKIKIPTILYVWKDNKNSITRKNDHAYSVTSYAPLCLNLTETYKKILSIESIDEDVLLTNFANRIIRLYYGYNGLYTVADPAFDLKEVDYALTTFYNSVLAQYWNKITQELLMSAWNELGHEQYLSGFVPNISLQNFIKKMRGIE